MALNKKIVGKIKVKTADDSFAKLHLSSLLARIEAGHQPKREIDKIIKEIKL